MEAVIISNEELRQMQSILYVFALKFLKKDEWRGMEEINLAVEDPEFRKSLYREYHIGE